ncbi:hypothetical protein [Salinibacterium sp. GXW1014]|uniref:hypothetical protein n=1 Tax=Salinibacterium sp. GXW1014 TaxID=3377838 RepID=UPI00383B19EF
MLSRTFRVALTLLLAANPGAEESDPSKSRGWAATLGGDSVDFTAEETTRTPDLTAPVLPGASNPYAAQFTLPEPTPWLPHDPCPGNVFIEGRCWVVPTEDRDPAAPLTISDFVSFAPTPAAPTTEPGAFAVRNLHTNFIADATAHIRTGTLLGQPASAEFTPVAYEWHYGDGTTEMTTTPGATWTRLGLLEFDRTPTSHAYADKGTYTVTLITHYTVRAAYASDGAWFPVPGTLAIASAPHTIQVVSVNTVLVDKTCAEDPAGPGC